jgi:hypothetical protein
MKKRVSGEPTYVCPPATILDFFVCFHFRRCNFDRVAALFVSEVEDGSQQGDQIGRVFDQWMVVYFGQLLNYTISPNVWTSFLLF